MWLHDDEKSARICCSQAEGNMQARSTYWPTSPHKSGNFGQFPQTAVFVVITIENLDKTEKFKNHQRPST
jgi:hypothetical protein